MWLQLWAWACPGPEFLKVGSYALGQIIYETQHNGYHLVSVGAVAHLPLPYGQALPLELASVEGERYDLGLCNSHRPNSCDKTCER